MCQVLIHTDGEDLIIDPNTPVPYPYASASLNFSLPAAFTAQLHSSTISGVFQN
jgi:hypothetical protein